MAILESRTKTGISWVTESVALFRTAPRKWLLLSLTYVGLFIMLPSVPALQLLSFISVLLWPAFLAIALAFYRNAEMEKVQNLTVIINYIKPKIGQLIGLGGACLLYAALVSLLLNSDLQGLATLAQSKATQPEAQMTEPQMVEFMKKMTPFLLKLTLLLIPLMMATWFAPMLIAFNNYSLVKAIKSSIAGSLQYIVALGAAWLVLTAGILALMLVVGIVAGIVSSLIPTLGQMLMSLVLFSVFLVATAIMLAFQYVSYRDVFRAA